MLSTSTAAAPCSRNASAGCVPNEPGGAEPAVSYDDADRYVANMFATSEVAALAAEPGLRECSSGKPALLLVLVCFLASSQISSGMLHRGGTPRNRWSEYGEMEEITAVEAGIAPELVALLSDGTELELAFGNLLAASVIRMELPKTGPPTFTVDDQVKNRVSERLPLIVRTFWRRQALLLVSHGFPRRYLDAK